MFIHSFIEQELIGTMFPSSSISEYIFVVVKLDQLHWV